MNSHYNIDMFPEEAITEYIYTLEQLKCKIEIKYKNSNDLDEQNKLRYVNKIINTMRNIAFNFITDGYFNDFKLYSSREISKLDEYSVTPILTSCITDVEKAFDHLLKQQVESGTVIPNTTLFNNRI